MSTTPPREESEMTTNIERAAATIREAFNAMSDFTIEQLEALKEGTTPGPWEAKEDHGGPNLFSPAGRLMISDSCGDVSGEGNDVMLMAAAPALVDALIAEKRKHDDLRQEIGSLIGKLETRADNAARHHAYASAVGFRETAQMLNRILEGE